MEEIPCSFFSRHTVQVAKDLLGKIVVVNGCKARIVETEAYGQDPASHAFKRTPRSTLMFDTFGHIYVYLIYGMYECVNFTTDKIGEPGAVLIRAVEPLEGMEIMKQKRGTEKIHNLCSGPGKLCQALGIDRSFNGLKLGRKIKLLKDDYKVGKIESSSRIGIKDALNLKWRFFIEGNEWVSKVKIK